MGHARPHAYRVAFGGADHGASTAMATTRERSRTCPLRHRAIDHCAALVHLLTHQLASTKRKAMSLLLDSARKTEFQLWAENAPFEFKDDLKATAGMAQPVAGTSSSTKPPVRRGRFLAPRSLLWPAGAFPARQNHRPEPVFTDALNSLLAQP
jgi:hypothetical protein